MRFQTLALGLTATLASFAPLMCSAQTDIANNASVAPRPATNESLAEGSVAPLPTPVPACTSSDECPDGLFCSSSTGACEIFNCTNWNLGTPGGEESFSEEPCDEEAKLEGSPAYDEGDRFCGWDGNCHMYSCEEWYKFGPVAFTSYDPNNPVELTCSDYDKGYDDNMNAVVNGCRPYIPGNKAPEAKNVVFFFNEQCTATPRGSDAFTCYQIKQNTDFGDFLSETARVNLASCDREIFENEQPYFWYEIVLRQQRKGDDILYKNERDDTRSTFSFDPSEADKTMYALLVSGDDPPPQSFPESETLGGSDSAPSMFNIWMTTAAVAAGLASLFFC